MQFRAVLINNSRNNELKMSQLSQWKKIKKSGAFRRRLKICYEKMISSDNKDSFVKGKMADQLNFIEQSTNFNNSASDLTSVSTNSLLLMETQNPRQVCDNNAITNLSTAAVDQLNDGEMKICDDEDEVKNNWLLELECEENTFVSDIEKNVDFRKNVRQWAVSFNIPQTALRGLFQIINKRFSDVLPQDPRTLLKTCNKSIVMIKIGDNGFYWPHGFEFSLRQVLTSMHDLPTLISVNINVDGLPIFKSSKCEFWPILFNIYELPKIKPMIIGIYCGKGKPSDLSAFLRPFVEEAKTILSNGLVINGYKITVKLRCFVCDSPARAFIKGVTNFNGKHGCLKCTTIGEYSHLSHTVYFSRAGCKKRTDSGFRTKVYGLHHRQETPLTLLPIDMIEDFPVGDSLHLIDLGVMKRCLVGWRDGSFGTYKTKWCGKDIAYVSSFLENISKLPSEIHRSARGLDVLCYWKASEYHTFLHYLSIVILQDVLPLNVYRHFLKFFCATTICSSKFYVHFLNLAEALFNNYVEYYRDYYGEDYITSNVHNLTHLVDEVRRYGPLSSFNAYPFENRLYQIKNLLRNGNLPLAQVANRMSEIMQCETECVNNNTVTSYPVFKNKNDAGLFFKVEFEGFSLSVDNSNKWFLTNNGQIVFMEHALVINDTGFINGGSVNDFEDVFEIPIKSSYLNIYKSRRIGRKTALTLYSVKNIKCKMVAIKYKDETFFIPLLHSL